MTTSSFDSFRPPDQRRRRRRDRGEGFRRRRGGGDGGGMREAAVVPDAEFSSYYGRPIIKPAPWGEEIAAYLFLGGLSAGSGLLAAGAQLTGNTALRRAGRFTALTSAGLGTIALIADLGRPERFLHMLRTFKVTSPMSVGSWILLGFSGASGLAATSEIASMLGRDWRPIRTAGGIGGLAAGVLAPGLAAYTAVLLTNTATPTWAGAREHLPFVFASSAAMAASGAAMILVPTRAAGPARRLALIGAAAELVASRVMLERMDETESEPLREGESGDLVRASTVLGASGAAATAVAGLAARRGSRAARVVAGVSGAVLLASSALNRLGVFRAGMVSTEDPRYVVEPQKRRLARRNARRGPNDPSDSIVT